VIQNKKKQAEILLIPALPPAQKRQSAKSPLPPAKKGSRQRALCHLSKKAVGKEPFATRQKRQSAKSPFATCQKRQSAKSPLPPAKKSSRQRNSIIKKIRKAAVGKGDALRHLTTTFVPFADCHIGRWQRLCRLLFSWQVAKVSLPTDSLPRVLCRLPRVKQSAKPLPPVLGPLRIPVVSVVLKPTTRSIKVHYLCTGGLAMCCK